MLRLFFLDDVSWRNPAGLSIYLHADIVCNHGTAIPVAFTVVTLSDVSIHRCNDLGLKSTGYKR